MEAVKSWRSDRAWDRACFDAALPYMIPRRRMCLPTHFPNAIDKYCRMSLYSAIVVDCATRLQLALQLARETLLGPSAEGTAPDDGAPPPGNSVDRGIRRMLQMGVEKAAQQRQFLGANGTSSALLSDDPPSAIITSAASAARLLPSVTVESLPLTAVMGGAFDCFAKELLTLLAQYVNLSEERRFAMRREKAEMKSAAQLVDALSAHQAELSRARKDEHGAERRKWMAEVSQLQSELLHLKAQLAVMDAPSRPAVAALATPEPNVNARSCVHVAAVHISNFIELVALSQRAAPDSTDSNPGSIETSSLCLPTPDSVAQRFAVIVDAAARAGNGTHARLEQGSIATVIFASSADAVRFSQQVARELANGVTIGRDDPPRRPGAARQARGGSPEKRGKGRNDTDAAGVVHAHVDWKPVCRSAITTVAAPSPVVDGRARARALSLLSHLGAVCLAMSRTPLAQAQADAFCPERAANAVVLSHKERIVASIGAHVPPPTPIMVCAGPRPSPLSCPLTFSDEGDRSQGRLVEWVAADQSLWGGNAVDNDQATPASAASSRLLDAECVALWFAVEVHNPGVQEPGQFQKRGDSPKTGVHAKRHASPGVVRSESSVDSFAPPHHAQCDPQATSELEGIALLRGAVGFSSRIDALNQSACVNLCQLPPRTGYLCLVSVAARQIPPEGGAAASAAARACCIANASADMMELGRKALRVFADGPSRRTTASSAASVAATVAKGKKDPRLPPVLCEIADPITNSPHYANSSGHQPAFAAFVSDPNDAVALATLIHQLAGGGWTEGKTTKVAKDASPAFVWDTWAQRAADPGMQFGQRVPIRSAIVEVLDATFVAAATRQPCHGPRVTLPCDMPVVDRARHLLDSAAEDELILHEDVEDALDISPDEFTRRYRVVRRNDIKAVVNPEAISQDDLRRVVGLKVRRPEVGLHDQSPDCFPAAQSPAAFVRQMHFLTVWIDTAWLAGVDAALFDRVMQTYQDKALRPLIAAYHGVVLWNDVRESAAVVAFPSAQHAVAAANDLHVLVNAGPAIRASIPSWQPGPPAPPAATSPLAPVEWDPEVLCFKRYAPFGLTNTATSLTLPTAADPPKAFSDGGPRLSIGIATATAAMPEGLMDSGVDGRVAAAGILALLTSIDLCLLAAIPGTTAVDHSTMVSAYTMLSQHVDRRRWWSPDNARPDGPPRWAYNSVPPLLRHRKPGDPDRWFGFVTASDSARNRRATSRAFDAFHAGLLALAGEAKVDPLVITAADVNAVVQQITKREITAPLATGRMVGAANDDWISTTQLGGLIRSFQSTTRDVAAVHNRTLRVLLQARCHVPGFFAMALARQEAMTALQLTHSDGTTDLGSVPGKSKPLRVGRYSLPSDLVLDEATYTSLRDEFGRLVQELKDFNDVVKRVGARSERSSAAPAAGAAPQPSSPYWVYLTARWLPVAAAHEFHARVGSLLSPYMPSSIGHIIGDGAGSEADAALDPDGFCFSFCDLLSLYYHAAAAVRSPAFVMELEEGYQRRCFRILAGTETAADSAAACSLPARPLSGGTTSRPAAVSGPSRSAAASAAALEALRKWVEATLVRCETTCRYAIHELAQERWRSLFGVCKAAEDALHFDAERQEWGAKAATLNQRLAVLTKENATLKAQSYEVIKVKEKLRTERKDAVETEAQLWRSLAKCHYAAHLLTGWFQNLAVHEVVPPTPQANGDLSAAASSASTPLLLTTIFGLSAPAAGKHSTAAAAAPSGVTYVPTMLRADWMDFLDSVQSDAVDPCAAVPSAPPSVTSASQALAAARTGAPLAQRSSDGLSSGMRTKLAAMVRRWEDEGTRLGSIQETLLMQPVDVSESTPTERLLLSTLCAMFGFLDVALHKVQETAVRMASEATPNSRPTGSPPVPLRTNSPNTCGGIKPSSTPAAPTFATLTGASTIGPPSAPLGTLLTASSGKEAALPLLSGGQLPTLSPRPGAEPPGSARIGYFVVGDGTGDGTTVRWQPLSVESDMTASPRTGILDQPAPLCDGCQDRRSVYRCPGCWNASLCLPCMAALHQVIPVALLRRCRHVMLASASGSGTHFSGSRPSSAWRASNISTDADALEVAANSSGVPGGTLGGSGLGSIMKVTPLLPPAPVVGCSVVGNHALQPAASLPAVDARSSTKRPTSALSRAVAPTVPCSSIRSERPKKR